MAEVTLAARALALDDREVVALTIKHEAGAEPTIGQVAVANVIATRAGLTWRGARSQKTVCLQQSQFSCWWAFGGPVNFRRLSAEVEAIEEGHEVAGLGRFVLLAELAEKGLLVDVTHGATHYVTKALLKTDPPAWSRGQVPVLDIGGHVFFKLEA